MNCSYILNSFLLFTHIVVLGIQPTIRSSVDGYKTVCPGEEVYFTCTVQNSVWLTWQSDQYIGQNTVIEFHRQFDHLGDGKSVSLPNASTSLFQLASLTNEKLESKSVIVVNKSAMDTGISCANDVQQIEERRLVLAGERKLMVKVLATCMDITMIMR